MNEEKYEVNKCLLCHDAPCGRMYKNINPERIIRALKLNNRKGARYLINDINTCLEKNNKCNETCPRNIDIDKIINNLIKEENNLNDLDNIDISTEICGVKLKIHSYFLHQ